MCNLFIKVMRVLAGFSVLLLVGCATNKQLIEPQDPYEQVNRKIFAFNMGVDKYVVQPVAKVYDKVTPTPARRGISNFFNNVAEVPTVANDLLQANPKQAVSAATRFAINTTIGIGGLFDVASHMGLERHRMDFGLTLNKWGAKRTPYVVLPFLGPSTFCDAVALPFNLLILDPIAYVRSKDLVLGIAGLRLVDLRAGLLVGDKALADAFDQYVFVRNAYLQRRAYLNNDQSSDIADSGDVKSNDQKSDLAKPIGVATSYTGV